MFISSITLRNIRGFGPEFRLDFNKNKKPTHRHTLVIGRNGTCKTTLLRCLALGVCWREDGNALIAEPIGPLITQGRKEASIEVTIQPTNKLKPEVTITSKLERQAGRRDFVAEVSGKELLEGQIFVWAAGAGRSGEGPEPYRDYQIVDSVYSLFNYEQSSLSPAELVIRRLMDYKGADKSIYSTAMAGIKRLLNLEKSASIRLGRGGGVFISSKMTGRGVPLEAWADGYRLTTNWLLDAYSWGMRANAVTKKGGLDGILLIDEIEQHIHPSLHATLLRDVSNLFPEAQIFATTHSPLTALGVHAEDLVALRKTEKGIERKPDVPNISDWSADDMLENERTFHTSVYGPDKRKAIRAYGRLMTQPKKERTAKQARQLAELAKKVAGARPSREVSPLLQDLLALSKRYDL
ncbi:MAG: hypothetical protein QOG66_730 [Methylobacteriaceae bacterium]|jgi:predicted ATPase|nr:hypothetical protein [Methylobacteriaceae bacterium]